MLNLQLLVIKDLQRTISAGNHLIFLCQGSFRHKAPDCCDMIMIKRDQEGLFVICIGYELENWISYLLQLCRHISRNSDTNK